LYFFFNIFSSSRSGLYKMAVVVVVVEKERNLPTTSYNLIGPIAGEGDFGVGGVIKRDVSSGLPDTIGALIAPLKCDLVSGGECGGEGAASPLSGPTILHLSTLERHRGGNGIVSIKLVGDGEDRVGLSGVVGDLDGGVVNIELGVARELALEEIIATREG